MVVLSLSWARVRWKSDRASWNLWAVGEPGVGAPGGPRARAPPWPRPAPRPSPSSLSDLALRPQASPSKFLTLLSQQLLSLRASPGLLSSLCLFPSAAPPPVKPIYIRCLPSSPSVSPPTHRFVVSSGPLNSTSSKVMTFLELNSRHVSGSRTHGHVFSVSLTVFPAPGL